MKFYNLEQIHVSEPAVCIGGYSEFEVFQDKYYWSSQPAYRIGKMDYVAKVTAKPACSWRREEERTSRTGLTITPATTVTT